MEDWRRDARREPIIVDLDALVPKDHLLRKIEKVMDYEWLYERLDPYYCHDNGHPCTRSGCAYKNGAPSAPVRYSFSAADPPKDSGYKLLPFKASANKKKFQKEQVAKTAKAYSGQLRREVNAEREKLGKKPIEDENDEDHPQGGLCGCERETRGALYTSPRLGRRQQMGQA